MSLLDMMLPESLQYFHFIRPYWLWMILPAAVAAILILIRQQYSSNWQKYFDETLLAPLLKGKVNKTGKRLPFVALAFWTVCTLALAGPAWIKLPSPIEEKQTALVIVLDLSPSMLAGDIKPSRLVAARHKILDLLKFRKEGYTALVSYSGDAHIVSPLTEDTQTIANLLNALDPGMMPVYGSNLEDALSKAQQLFKNAGYTQGDILLVTDGVTEQAINNTSSLLSGNPFTLSIIGVGTEAGAPIPDSTSGFVKDNQGKIILPGLHEAQLMQLAQQVNGYYSSLRLDDKDIEPLIEGTAIFNNSVANKKTERKFDIWQDVGGILTISLLPLVLIAFRRGIIICLLLIISTGNPTNTNAETMDQQLPAFSIWDKLWLNDNQRAMKAMKEQNYAAAAKTFKNQDWKAAAEYEAGNYTSALKQFRQDLSIDGLYNQGNALAKSGELQEAINAYNAALKNDPQFDDAAYNKKIVEDLLKQEQKQEQNKSGQEDEKKSQESPDDAKNESGSGNKTPDDKSNDSRQDQNREQLAREEKDNNKSDTDANKEPSDSGNKQPDQSINESSTEEKLTQEEKQALEQWLRQVPDDPSGLLRNKFEYYYQQRLRGQKSGDNDTHLNDEERW